MPNKIKVLYVEDDKEWQNIIEEITSKLGYQIEFASTSKEAIFKLKRSTYHVALLDKRLKEDDPENEDGLAIATIIARLGEGTRMIVYTAHGDIEDAREAFRDIKVKDFIQKNKISEVRKALEEAAGEAVSEFMKPARSPQLIAVDDEAIKRFITRFPSKPGLGSNVEDLELFARRMLFEYRPLIADRNEAQLLVIAQAPVLQIRFWSKMLGFPIAAWFGKFDEMKTILPTIDSEESLHLSLGITNKIVELFDFVSFPQFGGVIFELKDANIEDFVSRLDFRSNS